VAARRHGSCPNPELKSETNRQIWKERELRHDVRKEGLLRTWAPVVAKLGNPEKKKYGGGIMDLEIWAKTGGWAEKAGAGED